MRSALKSQFIKIKSIHILRLNKLHTVARHTYIQITYQNTSAFLLLNSLCKALF